jgi:beta-lactamase regulating signal transducer with metallopeptidase domain
MFLPFFKSAINTQLMEAIFYTLLHSLWLGALAAIAGAIILTATRRSTPQLRYNLLCVLLVLFCTGCGYILQYEYSLSGEQSPLVSTIALISETKINASGVSDNDYTAFSIDATIIPFLKKYSFLFVGAWLLVVLYKLIWFTADFKTLRDIRKSGTQSPGNEWENRLTVLASCIGINSPVQLKLSSATTVPMVIGIFKPVIIFPLALFNNLSSAEAEAILLHELAHIRRQDFLINVLQRFTEIIFFFNPPVRWISELIRRERENCCDDMAIAVTRDKKQYIYALVAFQEHHLNQQQGHLLTAFPGDGQQVFNRVNRILTNHNKSMNKMEKVLLASAIFVTAIFTLAFTSREHSDKGQQKEQQLPVVATQAKPIPDNTVLQTPPAKTTVTVDTLPGKQQVKRKAIMVYSTNINGKEYEMHKIENEIVQLKIDGKDVPVSQLGNHRAALDTIDKRLERDEAEMEANIEALTMHHELLEKNKELFMEKQLQLNEMQNLHIDNSLLMQDKISALNEIHIDNSLKNRKGYEAEILKELGTVHQKRLNELALNNELFSLKEKALADHYDILAKAQKESELAMLEHELAMEKHAASMQQHLKGMEMIDELVREGVITNPKNVKLKLNNRELIINGKKQPAEMHLRMLEKFQDKPGAKVNLEYNISN